jgi:DNA-binding SARP family transcriptional activator
MQIALLGPLRVTEEGEAVAIRPAKERAVLALLALRCGRAAGVEELTGALWGDHPPRSAHKTLQGYVSGLRRALPGGAIETVPWGYRLRLPAENIDVAVFERLVSAGGQALQRSDPHNAINSLAEALGLWRGDPLVELADQPLGAAEATRLCELRRGAEEDMAQARLDLGQHAALIGDLEAAVGADPLRERRWAQLMVALYRSGRQAEALRAYQRLRAQLAEQLGIEPSAGLRALEEAILLQRPDLDATTTALRPEGVALRPVGSRLVAHDASVAAKQTPSPSGRLVTFVFSDIEGSTSLWERHPADMAAVLARHDRLITEAVRAQGGQVFKTVGDAVHAMFAGPVAAVWAALAVQAGIAAVDWGAIGRLAVRIGIYTGEAQLVEGEWRGRPLNRCARLRDAAAGGQILASQATIELVGDDLAGQAIITDLGDHHLRGVTRTERAYQIRARPAPGPAAHGIAEAAPTGPSGSLPAPLLRAARRSLIGRSGELALVTRHLRDPSRDAVLVLIAGEPGVGKTRLAAAVAHQAAKDGTLVLFGRCDEGLRVPYQPFVEALGSYVNMANPEKLAVQLGAGGHELGRVLPGLAERVAGLRTPTGGDPETQRWLLFQGAAQFLQAVAAERRVLVVIDDLHWAEPATLLLLRHLARTDIDGLLLVATARPGEPAALVESLADLAREHRLHTIALGGLNYEEVAAVLADRLGRPADAAFTEAAHHRTGGNPFFVHELVSHLTDLGVLSRGAGDTSWPTGAQIEASGASEGMRQVLSRRIGQLSPSARQALMMAAVAGEQFQAADVAAASAVELGEVTTAFEETTTAGLTSEASEGPGRYRFVHALVRHALYESMSALRKAQWHWQIAEAIRTSAAHPERRLNELAYHCQCGLDVADPSIAVCWLQAAGDQAVRQVAFDEAREHYQTALIALDRGPDDPERRYDLLVGLAYSASALSDHDASYPDWLAAAEIAREAGDAARFLRAVDGYGAVIRVGGVDPSIERLVADGLALAGPGDSAVRARFLGRYFTSALDVAGRAEREQMVREALAMARRVNSVEAEIEVLANLGHFLLGSSRARENLEIVVRGQELSEATGAYQHDTWWLQNLSLVLLQLGDRTQAEHALQQAETLARTRGIHILLHNILMPRAAIAIAEGRLAEAQSRAAEARDIGGAHNLIIAYAYGAQVLAISAEEGRADVLIDALQPMSQDPPRDLVAGRAILAGLLADVDRLDEAAEHFEALAPDGFSIVPRDYSFPLAIRYLAETCAQLGDTTRGAELLPEIDPYSGQMLIVSLGTTIEGAADRSLGQLYGLIGRIDDAERHFENAWRLEDAMRFPALAARSRYWHARLLARSQDPSKREKAIALLQNTQEVTSQLGMALLHQQASKLSTSLHGNPPIRSRTAPAADSPSERKWS